MLEAKKLIWVTFQKEGIHYFPSASALQQFADVSFLGHEHRHMFHFKIWVEVFDDDREIEFIQFKRWISSKFDHSMAMENKSCEMLCDVVYDLINDKYPDRDVAVEVSEDGENGAYCLYPREQNNEAIPVVSQ